MLTADELPEGYKNLPAVCERLGLEIEWALTDHKCLVIRDKRNDMYPVMVAYQYIHAFRWWSEEPKWALTDGQGPEIESALLRRFAPAPQTADEPYVAMLAKVAALECRVAELEAKATTKAQADGFELRYGGDMNDARLFAQMPRASEIPAGLCCTVVSDLDSAEIKVDPAGELPIDCWPGCGASGGNPCDDDCAGLVGVPDESDHHASIAEAVIAADGPGVGDVAYARQQMQHALDILDGKSVPQWSRDRIEYARKAIADALRALGAKP